MLWRTIPKEEIQSDPASDDRSDRERDPSWVRQLMNIPFVGVAIFNARSKRWVRFNSRFCTITGYDRSELSALSWRDICHPDDVAAGHIVFRRLVARHSQHEKMRQRFVRKDGSIVQVEIDASDVKARTSHQHFVVALVMESPAEQAPIEARYRILWNACNIAVVLVDTDSWEVVDANPAAQAFYESTLDEIRSQGIGIWSNSPRERQLLKARLNKVSDGLMTRFEAAHRSSTGAVRQVEIYCGPAEIDGRRIVYGVAHDITKRVVAERALVDSEHRFRAVLEQSIAAVFVVQDGKVAYANPHMREIFGYAPGETFDPDPLVHIRKGDWPKVEAIRKQRLSGDREEKAFSVGALRKDGTAFTLGVHSTPAVYQDKPATIAVAKDITEKVRAEEDVRRYVAELRRAMQSTIEVVSIIGEMRDPYTHGHERRVGELAAEIGLELGLDADRVEGIRVAGYLHDIGKIGVPAELLAKPTRLTAAEFELIKGHAQQSYEILKGVDFPWPVAQVALQHHERLDGSGYPQGLAGDAILLESRIMSIADVVEAMSSHRPYRPGLGIARALVEIERGRGTVYDANASDSCLRLFREKGYELPV